jgi:hypothetical protein
MFNPKSSAPAHGESTAPQSPTSDSSTTGIQATARAFHGESDSSTTPPSDGLNAGAPTTYTLEYF